MEDQPASNDNKQLVKPRIIPARIFHCSVCNTTFKSQVEYKQHIAQLHKSKLRGLPSKEDLRQADSSVIPNDASKTCNYATGKKLMNPAKITDHSGLADAENRLYKTRFKHSFLFERNVDNGNPKKELFSRIHGQTKNEQDNSTMTIDYYTTTTIGKTPARRSNEEIQKEEGHYCDANKSTCQSIKSNQHIISSQYHYKKRKINTTTDIGDIEYDQQKIKTLFESPQEPHLEASIESINTKAKSNPHPIINDPNYYCRACHASHSTKDAYQDHLQQEHRMQTSSYRVASNHFFNRNRRKTPTVIHSSKLYKMTPIHINFGTKSSPSEQERISNVSIQTDLDDPNYYCKSCHITKSSKRSYLIHLSMMHKMASKKYDKTSIAK
ncbi:hypothetical protein [Parasitella parasitica]|uniref:C2H2-type domain-containing protein n=1 Tax=Parasitella parasitica TaxID=35722 RepID=A0A0B7MZN0_9FUNG|nr:hypothetical protein [Parasitella parasitica]